jgi:hypothetical protein
MKTGMACHEAVKDKVLQREGKKTGDPVLRLAYGIKRNAITGS